MGDIEKVNEQVDWYVRIFKLKQMSKIAAIKSEVHRFVPRQIGHYVDRCFLLNILEIDDVKIATTKFAIKDMWSKLSDVELITPKLAELVAKTIASMYEHSLIST